MTTKLNLFFLLILTPLFLFSQKPPANEDEFEKNYQKRIKQEYIFGVYIPKDLGDAFIQLNRLVDKDSKDKFKKMPEQQASEKLFFSLGRWITYNWGFYEGSRLSHSIKELGISYPDDMARFIIITYHRNLNRQKLDIKDLIDQFEASRLKEDEERKRKGTVIHEETRKRSKEQ